MGQAYRELNQLDSALKYFNKAIDINKNFAQGYFERGRAKQKNNDLNGACEDWKKASGLGYVDSTNLSKRYCPAAK